MARPKEILGPNEDGGARDTVPRAPQQPSSGSKISLDRAVLQEKTRAKQRNRGCTDPLLNNFQFTPNQGVYPGVHTLECWGNGTAVLNLV